MKWPVYAAIVVAILAVEVMCSIDCHHRGGVYLGREGVCVREGSVLR